MSLDCDRMKHTINSSLTGENKIFFSSPEPKAPGELIGWEGSVVRRPSSSSVHNFKRLLL